MTSNQNPCLLNMHDGLAKSGAEAADTATHLELELNGVPLSLEVDPTLPYLFLIYYAKKWI